MRKIKQINDRFENIQSKAPEWGAFLIYVISHIILSIFHENWYDECVAWMIAKYTSVKDILFYVPHYEGHPPLWHLILKVFAMMGMNYHTALSIVAVFFSSATVYLILFHSPFPRIIKILLPFTYFIFFQYGVISRPYCLMMFIFCLLAMVYKDRNIKPWCYATLLIILGLTSAYGIVIAFGLCIARLIEIIKEQGILKVNIAAKKQFLAIVMTCFGLFIIGLEILPHKNNYAVVGVVAGNTVFSFLRQLYYNIFCIIPDTFCYDVYGSNGIDLHVVAFVGLIILIYIYLYGKKKNTLAVFFIPYVFYGIFGSAIYMFDHHTGVMNLFFVFWLWVSVDTSCYYEITWTERINSIINNNLVKKTFSTIYVLALFYAFTISLYYSMYGSLMDVNYEFESGKGVTSFIKDYNLTDYRMMAGWKITEDRSYYNVSDSAYTVIPEFGYNIFDYQEYGCDGQYNLHVIMTDTEEERMFEKWRKLGSPEVIVGQTTLNEIYEENEIDFVNDYVYVFSDISHKTWKDNLEERSIGIYVKRELAEELGLQEIPKPVIVQIK